MYRRSAAPAKLLALSTSDLVSSSRFYFQGVFKPRCDLADSVNSLFNATV